MIITRRAFTAALSLTGLAALAGLSPLRLISDALAQKQNATAAEVAKTLSAVEDEELRTALARLGASIKRN